MITNLRILTSIVSACVHEIQEMYLFISYIYMASSIVWRQYI